MPEKKVLLSRLHSQTANLPPTAGVYLMKDSHGIILYIGKAANVRARVRSYFSDTHQDRPHIPPMLARLHTIEWIATGSETEALILEANLIRTHKPRFNIDLKDDKHYPYLKLTLQEPFPRLVVSRRVDKDGACYFGPYTDAAAMHRLKNLTRRIFLLRECKKRLPLSRPARPCINLAMRRCSGVCSGNIPEQVYRTRVLQAADFLRGRRKDLVAGLETQMKQAADRLDFEEAARIRDQLSLIRGVSSRQQVDLKLPGHDCDIFGIYEGATHTCLAVLEFREGLLLGQHRFLFNKANWECTQWRLDSIVLQFYRDTPQPPPREIILSRPTRLEHQALSEWFARTFKQKVVLVQPLRGTKARLVAMAEKNARLYGAQKAPDDPYKALELLATALELPRPPRTIEAFDISNLGAAWAVAGMVHYREGVPLKSAFRRFKMKNVEGQNDFAMMMEAVSRRMTRLLREGKELPECILIDGGPGQLNAAAAALRPIAAAPQIISLAKKEELLYTAAGKGPVRLPAGHPGRRLAQRIRDDVHRYTLQYHTRLRGTRFSRSGLEEVPGIGSRRARLLLRQFGSVQKILAVPAEQIAALKGFNIKMARELLSHLRAR